MDSENSNKAYTERNRLMVLAATLALHVGLHAGRYRDPEAREERFAWVVQIDLPTGQITVHIDADDTSGWWLLPEITRTWNGHVAQDAFAAVARFVEAQLDDIQQGLGLRSLFMAAVNRASAVEHGAAVHLQAMGAAIERERQETARLRDALAVALEQLTLAKEMLQQAAEAVDGSVAKADWDVFVARMEGPNLRLVRNDDGGLSDEHAASPEGQGQATEDEVELLGAWAAAGAPEGDAATDQLGGIVGFSPRTMSASPEASPENCRGCGRPRALCRKRGAWTATCEQENARRLTPAQQVAIFNETVRVGSPVLFRPLLTGEEMRPGSLRREAYLDAAGQPVVQLDGLRGGTFHLDHVELPGGGPVCWRSTFETEKAGKGAG